jgi:hypothetical protein
MNVPSAIPCNLFLGIASGFLLHFGELEEIFGVLVLANC